MGQSLWLKQRGHTLCKDDGSSGNIALLFRPIASNQTVNSERKEQLPELMLVTMSVCYDADNGVDDDDGGDGGDLVTVYDVDDIYGDATGAGAYVFFAQTQRCSHQL